MRKTILFLLLGCGLLLTSIAARSQESSSTKTFRDWWQTPEQQARQAWEKGDNDRLQAVAPNREWRGAAAYRQGDFEAALKAFTPEANEALSLSELYNQATTNIQLGDYANAITQLEEVLAAEPDNPNAIRNRDVAMRLLELEQQEQQQGEGGDGEPSDEQQSSEEGEQNDSQSENEGSENDDSESDESESEQSDEQSGGDQSSDQQNQSSSSENESSDDASDEGATSDEQRDEEIDAAREALQAAAEEADAGGEQSEAEAAGAALSDEPLSEEDQATEQWLRQIPDDPDDLLRRKLLQNHRNEYPRVQRNGRGY